MPPGDGDIFSEEQLVDRLASLVANNLMVSRWLFKLQDQVDGRGFGEQEFVNLGVYYATNQASLSFFRSRLFILGCMYL